MAQGADLPQMIAEAREREGRPITVGISGYCGSGKSTLARGLVEAVPGSIRMRGDDFLDPARSHKRSPDWDGVERVRLARDVLRPFQQAQRAQFQRYDWSKRELGAFETLPSAEVLVVDVIGLFHPEALPYLDFTIWVDADVADAAARGMRRDHVLGRDHDRLWNDVWIPNERDFDLRFGPRSVASVVVPAEAFAAQAHESP